MLLVDVNTQAVEKAANLVAQRFPNIKAAAFKADVSKEFEVKGAVDRAVELFGRLDVMVSLQRSMVALGGCTNIALRKR